MKQDLFTYLPPETITEILSRVPAQSILFCKLVCKSWHDLVSTHDFVRLHLSKSVPGLALIVKPEDSAHQMDKIIEHTNCLHLSTITKLYFTKSEPATIKGSAYGLLLLSKDTGTKETLLSLCNPITRECIDLHRSQSHPPKLGNALYGFGVSKISGQYKVLCIFNNQTSLRRTNKFPESECKVYTIGTGSWRSIARHIGFCYIHNHSGVFVNGSLHWLVNDLNGIQWISCFDLETELFTTYSLPFVNRDEWPNENRGKFLVLFALNGSPCLCEYTCSVVWLMKEYGVDKSWKEEFVIGSFPDFKGVYPVKVVSKDGIILWAYDSNSLLYYSTKNKTTCRICVSDGCVYMSPYTHTPSLISLKSFRMENCVSMNHIHYISKPMFCLCGSTTFLNFLCGITTFSHFKIFFSH